MIAYMNIETMLEDTPDQGMLYKLGIGQGMPNMCFFDHEGRIIARGIWRDLTREENMRKAYDEACWALKIIRTHEEKPEDTLAAANAALLEFYHGREAPPIKELVEMAKVKGVEKKLVDFLELRADRKPIDDLLEQFEKARTEAAEIAASKKMYALFKDGMVLDERKDKGFVRYWTMAFDGAVAEKDQRGAMKVRKKFAQMGGEGAVVKMLLQRMDEDLEKLGKRGR